MIDELSKGLRDLADEAPTRLSRPVTVSGLRARHRTSRWIGAAAALVALGGTAAAVEVLVPDGGDVLQQEVAAPASASPIPSPTAATTFPSPSPSPSASSAAVAKGIKAPPPVRLAETDEFGRITDIASDGTTLRVERVDMLSGQEAEEAAAAGNADVSNDYYLRERPEFWTQYTLDPNVVVWGSIRMEGSVEPVRVDLARLIKFVDQDNTYDLQTLFHLDVEDGRVIGIEEQYRP